MRSSAKIQIQQDMPLQEKLWKIERIGWFLFTAFILASFVGITGSGLLNHLTLEQDNLMVTYSPFARQQTPTQITVEIKKQHPPATHIWIDETFYTAYSIIRITPEPDDTSYANQQIIYTFTQNLNGLHIEFEVKPKKPQLLSSKVGLSEGKALVLNQLVFP